MTETRATYETKPTFRFDPKEHRYWLGDQELGHVTGILKAFGFIWEADEADLERGRLVHLACHYRALGVLDMTDLDPRLAGYVHGFDRFLKDTAAEIIESEVPRYHPEHLFAGMLDLRLIIRGWTWIIDLKSGKAPKWGGLQTGPYDLLLPPSDKPRKRGCLELDADGDYNLVPHTDRNDGADFLALLSAYRILKQNKVIKEDKNGTSDKR